MYRQRKSDMELSIMLPKGLPQMLALSILASLVHQYLLIYQYQPSSRFTKKKQDKSVSMKIWDESRWRCYRGNVKRFSRTISTSRRKMSSVWLRESAKSKKKRRSVRCKTRKFSKSKKRRKQSNELNFSPKWNEAPQEVARMHKIQWPKLRRKVELNLN